MFNIVYNVWLAHDFCHNPGRFDPLKASIPFEPFAALGIRRNRPCNIGRIEPDVRLCPGLSGIVRLSEISLQDRNRKNLPPTQSDRIQSDRIQPDPTRSNPIQPDPTKLFLAAYRGCLSRRGAGAQRFKSCGPISQWTLIPAWSPRVTPLPFLIPTLFSASLRLRGSLFPGHPRKQRGSNPIKPNQAFLGT